MGKKTDDEKKRQKQEQRELVAKQVLEIQQRVKDANQVHVVA